MSSAVASPHTPRLRAPILALVTLCAAAAVWALTDGLSGDGRLTLCVSAAAIAAWVSGRFDDTYVALLAATALVAGGVVAEEVLFSSLGDSTIWLLIGSFIVARAFTESGLGERLTALVLAGAGTIRSVAYRVAAALSLTTFAIPATSGRAALAVPVFVALSRRIGDARVSRALAILCPTVILLSAAASLLGAAAHVIADELIATIAGEGLGFVRWMILGAPFAAVSVIMSTGVVLRLFLRREERQALVTPADHDRRPLSGRERLVLGVVGAQIAGWLTEPLHAVDPALVALAGALVVSFPRSESAGLARAIDGIPWSLLVFLAATLVLGEALVDSGAAPWLVAGAVGEVGPGTPAAVLVGAVIVLGLLSHLVIGSRSARSTVITPLVILAATPTGVDPTALAFCATIAAGYCLTLTASAKPVAIFAATGEPGYSARDLQLLSLVLIPLHACLLAVFAAWVWPALGLPVLRSA